MSHKKTIVIWGGWWDDSPPPKAPEMLNSNASVTAYFLGKELEYYFDVVRIHNFGRIDEAIKYRDAIAILSTYQMGFTKLKQKLPEKFRRVRRETTARFCSILDIVGFQRYEEDVIFTVIPKKRTPKNLLKWFRAGAYIFESGWCAAPEYCNPIPKKGRPFTIFLDHGHYAGSDFTHLFVNALNVLANDTGIPEIRVLYQSNRGVEQWSIGESWHFEKYKRISKVPWLEMVNYYRNTDIFCITHKETAGLSALEAAMSGATLCVPSAQAPFINTGLLNLGVDYIKVKCDVNDIASALKRCIRNGVDNYRNHQAASNLHWAAAARRIHTALASL